MAWRKSWSKQNLKPGGTKRQLTPAQRSIWDDLLDLAENAHDGGAIWAFEKVGFTTDQLADIFKTSAPVITEALARFASLDMIAMNGAGVIVVKNWSKYQSDYDRVKNWRKGHRRE